MRAYLGVGSERWQDIREADPTLRTEMAKAVATFEMIHVRNLHARVQETSDWRGIAWWLAQRFPNRYGTGRESKQVEKAVEEVLTVLDEARAGNSHLRRKCSAWRPRWRKCA